MQFLLRLRPRSGVSPSKVDPGFTLIELLIGMILTFLIITPLLGFVISLLTDDQKEQIKTTTDQEISSAIEFINEDLSQARYIYDNATLNAPGNIAAQLPAVLDGTPILAFWKRKLIDNSVPNTAYATPLACRAANGNCSDAYVDALVAYYLVQPGDKGVWCRPDSAAANCPARITRVEIHDGIRDLSGTLYTAVEADQTKTPGFRPLNSPTDPRTPLTWTRDGTYPANLEQVLVNYIDRSTTPTLSATYCQQALSNPTTGNPAVAIPETTLRIASTTSNGFIACVDSSRSIAHISLRGNALRRSETNAQYSANKSAFFPTYKTTVRGQSTPLSIN
ncbi:MAG: type II secretion system protein [Leptolyngbyaceae cyanobacterium RM2_2_4]|nr:type II secretion system protein [Leptolyngbyaceae cyanobacterium RM2_2_4]